MDLDARLHDGLATVWFLLDFFTITTNLLVAGLATAAVARWPPAFRPRRVAGLALSILLVGVVNALLLRGLYPFTPLGFWADILLHDITPTLVPVFWLMFIEKGQLRLRDPLLWSLYPIGYFAYALVRAAIDGHYPYPFMDVSTIGWQRTIINALVISLGYFATGAALVWLDAILGRRSQATL